MDQLPRHVTQAPLHAGAAHGVYLPVHQITFDADKHAVWVWDGDASHGGRPGCLAFGKLIPRKHPCRDLHGACKLSNSVHVNPFEQIRKYYFPSLHDLTSSARPTSSAVVSTPSAPLAAGLDFVMMADF